MKGGEKLHCPTGVTGSQCFKNPNYDSKIGQIGSDWRNIGDWEWTEYPFDDNSSWVPYQMKFFNSRKIDARTIECGISFLSMSEANLLFLAGEKFPCHG